MYKKGKNKNLLDLFVKKVKKEDLPELSIRTDISDLKKEYEKFDKYEKKLEEIRAPLYRKKAEKIRIDIEEMKEQQKKEEEIFKQMKNLSGELLQMEGKTLSPRQLNSEIERIREHDPVMIDDPWGLCEEITVKICKEKVCVDQPIPLHVDSITKASGSGCSFQKYGDNKFVANDGVSGYSYYSGLNYHRGTRTSVGAINILASGALVERAKVNSVGITYKRIPDPNGQRNINLMNQASSCGEYKVIHVDSWGRAKKHWDLKITSIIPGGPAATEFDSADDIITIDTGKCYQGGNHGCIYLTCGQNNTILGVENPPNGQVTITYQLLKDFPAGTIFLVESSFGYWIRAKGEHSNAYVHFGLEILPFVNIEACSYEYPENVTIRVSDWL
ncbi:MAG: hypothetical protein E3J56_04320 [Candidatus Aminicenantes bacterium]|nr:MAG: hypothetical protein E3J56_04320 [Candidatus Aminicenantes bacterium]